MQSWKEIKEGFSDVISDEYLEFMSSRDMLLLFISGMPVVDIAEKLELDEEVVENCLLQYFPLYGIMEVIENCNPAFIFRTKKNEEDYTERIVGKTNNLLLYYEYCTLFYRLEKEFKNE